jgi:hypothetical protein
LYSACQSDAIRRLTVELEEHRVANLDAMDLVGERRCHELSGRFLGARSALESFWKTLPARRGNCGSRSRRGRDGLLRVSRFLAVPGDSFPPPARTRGPEFDLGA